MDLTPLIQAATALAVTVATALMGYAATALRDWLARQRLDTALGRAAGIVLADPAVQIGAANALAEASAAGAAYVQRAIPGTLAQLAVPPDRVRAMVLGEAGKLLAPRA